MSELFTITTRHVLAVGWIVLWSIPFTAKNKNNYYTYFDRVGSWFVGIIVGLIAGALLFL